MGTLEYCYWGCILVQPPSKTTWRFLRKPNIELPYNPEVPLLKNQDPKKISAFPC